MTWHVDDGMLHLLEVTLPVFHEDASPKVGCAPPTFPTHLGQGGLLGKCFPRPPFGETRGDAGGAFPQCGGRVSPKGVLLGAPSRKWVLLDASPPKGDSWASPLNFWLIRLKKKKKQTEQKLKSEKEFY
jgi:hypothetical protein